MTKRKPSGFSTMSHGINIKCNNKSINFIIKKYRNSFIEN